MAGRPRKRGRRADPADVAGDRLSDLHDDIILRVVSHLNARQAVQTCVLGRRWRNLWRSLPRINAEFFEFNAKSDTEEGDEILFKNFVDRLLERRDPVALLDKFWLRYSVSDGDDPHAASADANRWFSHALEKKARALEVVVLAYPLELDHAVFTSRHLRRLGLSNVFLRHGFFEQLNRGCSALEDMFLYDAIIMDQEFSSQTLKVLTIDYSQFSDEYQTSISIQSLVHLSLECPAGRVPSLQNMTSLVTASIRVLEENVVADTHQFLSGLSGVRNLDLNYPGKELEMDTELQWCPKFSNLTNLTLGHGCLGANFSTLTVFLQNSPMLEKLSLKLPEHGLSASAIIIGEPKERSFTCEHLQIVEVTCEDDNPLLNCAQDYLVAKGITSVQIRIKRPSQIRREEPEFFRYEYR